MGLATIYLREQLLSNDFERVWTSINNLLFADITAVNNEKAIGLFYISGQIFLRLLQILLIPLIFTSIIKAIEQIKGTSLLNKLAKKKLSKFCNFTSYSLNHSKYYWNASLFKGLVFYKRDISNSKC